MKNHIHFFFALMTLLSLSSCGNKKGQAGQAMAMGQNRVTPVVAVQIPTDTVTTFQSFPTSIEGVINSAARPKISGYITQVYVDEGEKVHKGQLMFRLETSSLSQQAKAAKANINVAQVKVDQLKPLVKKEIVSQNQLATAKAQLAQAKSNYQSIVANINYGTVRSPVNGYVGAINFRKGNLVSPSSQIPLTTVSDISEVYAYFSMNERDYLNFIAKAQGKTRNQKIANLPPVTLVLANGAVYGQKGTIQTINSQIDPQTGTITFRAIFDNPKGILTNGSTGTIRVPKTFNNVLVVPQKSTFEQQGRTFVMKVHKTDSTTTVSPTPIEVIGEKGNLYLVGSGLKKGETIVAEGVSTLRPGTPVKPMVQPFDSIAKPVPVKFN